MSVKVLVIIAFLVLSFASYYTDTVQASPDAGRVLGWSNGQFRMWRRSIAETDMCTASPMMLSRWGDEVQQAAANQVLEPAQWLPADAPKDAFAAQREVSTRIGFEAPGVAAAGYRVYVFYP